MEVIGRAYVSDGLKAHEIKSLLKYYISELVTAYGTQVNGMYITGWLCEVQRAFV